MTFRRVFSGLAVIIMVMVSAVSVATHASAAPVNCEQTVVDSAGLFGERLADVQSAAGKLQAEGPVVRVLTTADTSGVKAAVEQFGQMTAQQCGWSTSSTTFRTNLIMVVVSKAQVADGSQLRYGDTWSPVLSGKSVKANVMVPYFQQGRFADGTIAGLDKITQLVHDANTPRTTPAANATPVDGQMVLTILGVIAGIFGLAGLFVFVYSRVQRRREERIANASYYRKANDAARHYYDLIKQVGDGERAKFFKDIITCNSRGDDFAQMAAKWRERYAIASEGVVSTFTSEATTAKKALLDASFQQSSNYKAVYDYFVKESRRVEEVIELQGKMSALAERASSGKPFLDPVAAQPFSQVTNPPRQWSGRRSSQSGGGSSSVIVVNSSTYTTNGDSGYGHGHSHHGNNGSSHRHGDSATSGLFGGMGASHDDDRSSSPGISFGSFGGSSSDTSFGGGMGSMGGSGSE